MKNPAPIRKILTGLIASAIAYLAHRAGVTLGSGAANEAAITLIGFATSYLVSDPRVTPTALSAPDPVDSADHDPATTETQDTVDGQQDFAPVIAETSTQAVQATAEALPVIPVAVVPAEPPAAPEPNDPPAAPESTPDPQPEQPAPTPDAPPAGDADRLAALEQAVSELTTLVRAQNETQVATSVASHVAPAGPEAPPPPPATPAQ